MYSDGAVTNWSATYDPATDSLVQGSWTGECTGTFHAHRKPQGKDDISSVSAAASVLHGYRLVAREAQDVLKAPSHGADRIGALGPGSESVSDKEPYVDDEGQTWVRLAVRFSAEDDVERKVLKGWVRGTIGAPGTNAASCFVRAPELDGMPREARMLPLAIPSPPAARAASATVGVPAESVAPSQQLSELQLELDAANQQLAVLREAQAARDALAPMEVLRSAFAGAVDSGHNLAAAQVEPAFDAQMALIEELGRLLASRLVRWRATLSGPSIKLDTWTVGGLERLEMVAEKVSEAVLESLLSPAVPTREAASPEDREQEEKQEQKQEEGFSETPAAAAGAGHGRFCASPATRGGWCFSPTQARGARARGVSQSSTASAGHAATASSAATDKDDTQAAHLSSHSGIRVSADGVQIRAPQYVQFTDPGAMGLRFEESRDPSIDALIIKGVVPGGAAERMGGGKLVKGMVLTSVQGHPVADAQTGIGLVQQKVRPLELGFDERPRGAQRVPATTPRLPEEDLLSPVGASSVG